MKLIERVKTFELLIFMGLAALCFYMIVVKSNVYHLIADSKELQLVCILLWVSLFSAFIFIFVDLSLYTRHKKAINALDYAVHSDNLAKIANRQGIDEIIDKYVDMPLPENFGCAMFLLVSLNDINKNHTRAEGNNQIRNFSIILKLASADVCFVGRNGGNVFMALFEDADSMQVEAFMLRVNEKVREYNRKKDNLPMYYQVGLAYHEKEPIDSINNLISLASRRSREAEVTPEIVKNDVADQISVQPKETESVVETLSESVNTNEEEPLKGSHKKKPFEYIDDYDIDLGEDYRYSDEELNGTALAYY